MPSTLFQREKKTGSKCATMARTSLMTTQGGTMAQVTGKQTRPPQARPNTARVNIGQNSDRTHHTVNFNNREQHRTSTLEEVQHRLTQIAQENSSANTENICPAHPSDNPPNNRRWRNMAERHQRFNGQDNNSSAASDSGTSTDWDGRWGTARMLSLWMGRSQHKKLQSQTEQ